MALKGDLASVDLAQVFQMLALNQKVGMLSIQSPRTWRALYFDRRGVTLYFNEHSLVDRVLANLTRVGRMDEMRVREVRDHAAKMGMPVVDCLLAGGYVDERELEQLYRTELEEEIYDLFFWNDARFEFYEGATSFEGREGCIDDRLFFSTDSLIMEAARRIDEWSYVSDRVTGPLEIFQPSGRGANVSNLDDNTLAVFDLVDGKRNVARIGESSGLPPFHVYKSLALLMDEQLVQMLPERDLMPTGKECLQEGRLVDAINLFEKAISVDVGLPEVHSLAAQAYESAREFELAVYHHKCMAEFTAGTGDVRTAIDRLRRAIELLPTDLEARERVVELAMGHPEAKAEGFDPMEQGKFLVDLYLDIGEVDRVRGVLERLLRENPEDLELKKILINVHSKAGDTRRVIELYESMAEDLVAMRRPIEAINYLQKILRLDRTRSDINDKIRALYRLDERRRSRRRSLVALGALFFGLVVLAGVYWFYDQKAREEFASLDAGPLIEQYDFKQAEALYARFAERYPFTMAARDAEAEITRIAGLRMAHEARLQRERDKRSRELQKVRARYRMAMHRHRDEFRSGDPEASLRSLEEVRDLVFNEAGEPEDLTWAEKQKVEESYRSLKEFLAEAAALDREARQKLDDGDWRGARKLLLELVTEYDVTRTARAAQVPVLITSRPAGARILRGNEPLKRTRSGEKVDVETPAVVFCRHDRPEEFILQLEGFEDQEVRFDARREEVVERVLTVVPAARISFIGGVQTAVGAGGGLVAAGLRDGRLGIATAREGRVAAVARLGGLSAVRGRPVVAGSSVYFTTNEGYVDCWSTNGRRRPGWPVRPVHDPAHDPVVQEGRVLFADIEGRLLCLAASDGRELWTVPLDGRAAGPPTVDRRTVWIGTQSGAVLGIDASDGSVRRRFPVGAGVSTAVQVASRTLVFGCTDGYVRAISRENGRQTWECDVGRAVSAQRLVLGDDSVVAVGRDDHLFRIDLAEGTVEAEVQIRGRLQGDLVAQGGRLFLVNRHKREERVSYDVLTVLGLEDLRVQWRYDDGGVFVGGLTTDSESVYLPVSTGDVVVFR